MKRLFSLILLAVLLVSGAPAKAATVANLHAVGANDSLYGNGGCVTTFSSGAWTAPDNCSGYYAKPTVFSLSLGAPSNATQTTIEITGTICSGQAVVWDQDNVKYTLINTTGIDTDDPVLNRVVINKKVTAAVFQIEAFGCSANLPVHITGVGASFS